MNMPLSLISRVRALSRAEPHSISRMALYAYRGERRRSRRRVPMSPIVMDPALLRCANGAQGRARAACLVYLKNTPEVIPMFQTPWVVFCSCHFPFRHILYRLG